MADVTYFRSRRSQLDKERALNTARNPGDSKYGTALYKNNAVEDLIHSAELRRIDNQLKRTSMHMDQKRKQFLQRYTLKEPMLIVVRPPSPGIIEKHEDRLFNIAHDFDYGHPLHKGGPRYMQQLDSKTRIPNYRPTIDAFCLQTKKKVNVWEHALLEKETPKFRSTVMPSYPLSNAEIRDLVKGMEYHKLEIEAGTRNRVFKTKKRRKKKHTEKIIHALPSRTEEGLPEPVKTKVKDEDDPPQNQWHFVTDTPTESVNGQGGRRTVEDKEKRNDDAATSADRNTATIKLPSLRVRTSESDEVVRTKSNLTTPLYSRSKNHGDDQNDQLANTDRTNSKGKASVNERKSNILTKSRSMSTTGQSQFTGSIGYNTTAICIVHEEPGAININTNDITEKVFAKTPKINVCDASDVFLEPSKERKEDLVMESPIAVNDSTDQQQTIRKTNDDCNMVDKDNPREQLTQSGEPHNRRRSGLAIILEAALEGMSDTAGDPDDQRL